MPIALQWIRESADDPNTVVEILPGLRFPKYFDVFVTDEPWTEVDVRISAVFDLRLERYVVDRLEVVRRGPRDDITGAALRSVKVQEILRSAVRQAFRKRAGTEESFGEVVFELSSEEVARIRKLGPSSDEALGWTARIYKFAAAVNESPAKAVQEQLGLTAPTASVWIRRARDRGILLDPDATEGTTDAERMAFQTARAVGDHVDWLA